MHKREKKRKSASLRAASAPLPAEADHPIKSDRKSGPDDDPSEPVSPAVERAADAVVKRATRGLMRLDSRRRLRLVLRRVGWLLAIAAAVGGLGYFFADAMPTDLLSDYWDQLKDKVRAALPEDRPS